jgi:hypothetical protein
MEVGMKDWLNSTQGLIAAITAVIAGLTTLLQALRQLVTARGVPSKPPGSPAEGGSDQGIPESRRSRMLGSRWLVVTGVILVLAGGIVLASRQFSSTSLPRNAQLAQRAWDALAKNDWNSAIQRATECVDEFGAQAEALQAELQMQHAPVPPTGAVSETEKNTLLARGLLNDAGACLFVKARAAEMLSRNSDARIAYEALAALTYARVYDPGGFFWSPAKAASAKLKKSF